MVTSDELSAAIRSRVEGVQNVVVSDVSGGCGQAFDVIIVSAAFQGLTTLKRHRLVNDALKEEIASMHAFSQKTYTPAVRLCGCASLAGPPLHSCAAFASPVRTWPY